MLWCFNIYSICNQRPLLAVHRSAPCWEIIQGSFSMNLYFFQTKLFSHVLTRRRIYICHIHSYKDVTKHLHLTKQTFWWWWKTPGGLSKACSNKLYPPRLVLYFSVLYAVMLLYFCVMCNRESRQIFFYKTVTFRKQKASRMNQNSYFNQSDP